MRTLSKAVRRGLKSGEPLPVVFKTLKDADIVFRRGGVHAVYGRTGAGKTQFVTALVDEMKVPTLYISNDSDEMTVASRLISRRTGADSNAVSEQIQKAPEWAASQLTNTDHIKWNFNPSPSLPEVEEEVLAFQEVYGQPPMLIVVDILLKMNLQEDTEHGTVERIIGYLDTLAREYNACVILVHHGSEGFSGDPCQPSQAFLGKRTQFLVLLLSVAALPYSGTFAVCATKNRHGRQDPSGRQAVYLQADLSRNWFADITER